MSDIKANLRFNNYQVNYMHFERDYTYDGGDIEANININKNIEFFENRKIAVTLDVEVFPKEINKVYPFNLKISCTGYFEHRLESNNTDGDISEEVRNLANINAVAILFPYIRAMISTYTTIANIPPFILPPINVLNLFKED